MRKLKFEADIKNWLQRAEEDKKWAQISLANGFYPQTCFIAQQIAEKSLKAFLLSCERVPEKTHSLPKLVNLSASLDRQFKSLKGKAEILDKYYAPTRYPDLNLEEEYDKDIAQEALEYAAEILKFVIGKIKI